MFRSYGKLSIIYVSLSLLAGCGLLPVTPGKWTHPTNTPAMMKKDHYQCVNEAWKVYPKKMGYVPDGVGYWERAQNAISECRYDKYANKTYCTYTPAKERQWVPPKVIEGDENTVDRAQEYEKCMTAKDSSYQCIRNGKAVHGSLCGNYKE